MTHRPVLSDGSFTTERLGVVPASGLGLTQAREAGIASHAVWFDGFGTISCPVRTQNPSCLKHLWVLRPAAQTMIERIFLVDDHARHESVGGGGSLQRWLERIEAIVAAHLSGVYSIPADDRLAQNRREALATHSL